VPGILEPFRKPGGREIITSVPIDEEVRRIFFDDASRCSFQGFEENVVNCANIGITFAKGADVALYSGNQ
jgi:hypothetical protein